MLEEDITLLLPDVKEFSVHYCCSSGILTGLKKILDKNEVEENYIFILQLIGKKLFYVSMFNTFGMDIFNYKDKKLGLKEVLHNFKNQVLLLSNSSLEGPQGTYVTYL